MKLSKQQMRTALALIGLAAMTIVGFQNCSPFSATAPSSAAQSASSSMGTTLSTPAPGGLVPVIAPTPPPQTGSPTPTTTGVPTDYAVFTCDASIQQSMAPNPMDARAIQTTCDYYFSNPISHSLPYTGEPVETAIKDFVLDRANVQNTYERVGSITAADTVQGTGHLIMTARSIESVTSGYAIAIAAQKVGTFNANYMGLLKVDTAYKVTTQGGSICAVASSVDYFDINGYLALYGRSEKKVTVGRMNVSSQSYVRDAKVTYAEIGVTAGAFARFDRSSIQYAAGKGNLVLVDSTIENLNFCGNVYLDSTSVVVNKSAGVHLFDMNGVPRK